MHTIRKAFALAFAATLAFVLAGCSGTGNAGSASGGAAVGGDTSNSSEAASSVEEHTDERGATDETSQGSEATVSSSGSTSSNTEAATMNVEVNGTTFSATFENTPAAEEFRALLPLTVSATELNGNEKYAQLGQSLSMEGASAVSPIKAGDIFLYGGNDVVLFYEPHDNTSWQYVPIAHIDDPSGLAEAVGSGNATIGFSA